MGRANSDWVDYNLIDFSNESIKQYHIDTRDFCCLTNTFDCQRLPPEFELKTMLKSKRKFLLASFEVKELIDKLFKESGGYGDWRMLSINGGDKYKGLDFWFKYIRIYRTKYGLIIKSHIDGKCIPLEAFQLGIDKSSLNFISYKKVKQDESIL